MATITKECKGKFVERAENVGGGMAGMAGSRVLFRPCAWLSLFVVCCHCRLALVPCSSLNTTSIRPSIQHFPAGITLCARLHSPIYFIKFSRAHTHTRVHSPAVGISRSQGHPIRRLRAVLLMHFKCD